MNNINYVFFEEYKKLEKICQEMYNSPNGVTNYIEEMKSVPSSDYWFINNWDADLRQLKRVRYIRNNLAHEEGAFDKNICTQNDVEWVKKFYKRILNQSDPIAMKYRHSKLHTRKTGTGYQNSRVYEQKNTKMFDTNKQTPRYNQSNAEKSDSSSTMITGVVIAIMLVAFCVLMADILGY